MKLTYKFRYTNLNTELISSRYSIHSSKQFQLCNHARKLGDLLDSLVKERQFESGSHAFTRTESASCLLLF